MSEAVEASRESEKEEKGKDGKDLYRLWMDAIHLSGEEEKDWRPQAEKAVSLYRQERSKAVDETSNSDKKFNIFHANVETIIPALYNSTPIPDVRRRYDDKNPIGKQVADIIERSISYCVDNYDFDEVMRYAVSDEEITGRAVSRVRYMPYTKDDELVLEEVQCEHVPWKHFRRGPGRAWPDVPWIAFELFLTRDELLKLTPELGGQINLDTTIKGANDRKDGDNPPEIFKRAKVWEIWDKNERKILFFAESYKDGPIREEDDPLGLMGFFPIPRPIYAIQTSDTLVPVVPYETYKDQAEELERVSQRIMALTEAMKARGVYDARLDEISKLADSDDNTLVPIKNVASVMSGTTKTALAEAIAYWPIETIVVALEKLYLARDQIKQTIYEITGIADILRGSTDPNETLGAQELKAQWGSLRIQRKQAEIARYARDIFRLKAEIIATKFDPNTIQMMTGIPLVPGPQDPPEVAQQKQAVLQMLQSDALRGFNVDIESDSTVRADLTRKQQNMNLFLQGTAQYAAAMGPIVMAPQFQSLAPAVIEVFSAFARNFKLGKQAEDALDSIADQAKKEAENPQPPPEDPSVQVEKLKAQNEQVKAQQEAQFREREHAMKLEAMQADLRKKEMELQFKERELAMKEQEMAMTAQYKQQEIAMNADAKRQETEMGLKAKEQETSMTLGAKERGIEMDLESQRQSHELKNGKPTKIPEVKPKTEDLVKPIVDLVEKMGASHTDTITALTRAVDRLSAPKKVIRDEKNRVVGVEAA